MSQGSRDNAERLYLEWLHHAGCSEALQDQLEAEDQDACIPLKVSCARALDRKAGVAWHWRHSKDMDVCVEQPHVKLNVDGYHLKGRHLVSAATGGCNASFCIQSSDRSRADQRTR